MFQNNSSSPIKCIFHFSQIATFFYFELAKKKELYDISRNTNQTEKKYKNGCFIRSRLHKIKESYSRICKRELITLK